MDKLVSAVPAGAGAGLMCARCPAGGRWPHQTWPAARPDAGDFGGPHDFGAPDHGKAPAIRWFWQPSDQGWSWWRGRYDRKPRFIFDGR